MRWTYTEKLRFQKLDQYYRRENEIFATYSRQFKKNYFWIYSKIYLRNWKSVEEGFETSKWWKILKYFTFLQNNSWESLRISAIWFFDN